MLVLRKPLFCGLLMSAIAASGVFAQAPQRFANEAEGYSFSALKGWTSQANGEGYALANPEKTIIIVVKSHTYKDFAAFLTDANIERDGLEVVGKAQDITGGKTFRTVKRSPQGMAVFDTSVLFSNFGGGVVVVAITNEANANAGFASGLAVASSVKFEGSKQSDAAAKVRTRLAGKLLTYVFAGNGYSERKDILLCSSGAFYQTTDMGGFTTRDVEGPSFTAAGGRSGQWSIDSVGSKLLLSFRNGSTAEFTLSARQASNEIALNNQRFFVQSQNKCQ